MKLSPCFSYIVFRFVSLFFVSGGCVLPTYVSIPCGCLVSMEVRRVSQIPWSLDRFEPPKGCQRLNPGPLHGQSPLFLIFYNIHKCLHTVEQREFRGNNLGKLCIIWWNWEWQSPHCLPAGQWWDCLQDGPVKIAWVFDNALFILNLLFQNYSFTSSHSK